MSSDDVSSKNDNNWPYTFLEAPTPVRTDGDFDRHHAREFTKSITNALVPKLLKLRTSIEVIYLYLECILYAGLFTFN